METPPRFISALLLSLSTLTHAQWRTPTPEPETGISTDSGTCSFPAGSHPLSFWTHDPLARRCVNDPLLGISLPAAVDGQPITERDFHLDQTVTTLGTIAGHRIVQIILLIRPGPHALSQGVTADPDNPDSLNHQWKTLLVQSGTGDLYTQIYGAQFGVGTAWPFKSATIYGTGNDQILATYEPDTGNGGGCWDGYWWFDRTGVYPVDFSELNHAIQQKLPPNTGYVGRCGYIAPKTNSIRSGVQRTDAECHACGFVGDVTATYRIHHGRALPVAVTYTPSPNPD